jgi:HSP20 family protein
MFLVPFSPALRNPSLLARSIERLFDESFDRLDGNGAALAQRSPWLDVAETDDSFTVTIEMPGVAKEDVKIAIDGRRVNVSAQSKGEASKQDGQRVIYRERSSSNFARSFALPEEVDQEASQAKLDNGVLQLTLAKKRAAAKQLTVN